MGTAPVVFESFLFLRVNAKFRDMDMVAEAMRISRKVLRLVRDSFVLGECIALLDNLATVLLLDFLLEYRTQSSSNTIR